MRMKCSLRPGHACERGGLSGAESLRAHRVRLGSGRVEPAFCPSARTRVKSELIYSEPFFPTSGHRDSGLRRGERVNRQLPPGCFLDEMERRETPNP